jgi:hypothetical protein
MGNLLLPILPSPVLTHWLSPLPFRRLLPSVMQPVTPEDVQIGHRVSISATTTRRPRISPAGEPPEQEQQAYRVMAKAAIVSLTIGFSLNKPRLG